MRQKSKVQFVDTWDEGACKSLIEQLWSLRTSMLENEAKLEHWLGSVDPSYKASARNLAHYLTQIVGIEDEQKPA